MNWNHKLVELLNAQGVEANITSNGLVLPLESSSLHVGMDLSLRRSGSVSFQVTLTLADGSDRTLDGICLWDVLNQAFRFQGVSAAERSRLNMTLNHLVPGLDW